jgi:hypothetical protein
MSDGRGHLLTLAIGQTLLGTGFMGVMLDDDMLFFHSKIT